MQINDMKILEHLKELLCTVKYAYFAGLVLMFGAEVLWPFPASCRQVKDGSGSHVCSLGIVGIIVSTGGGGRAAFGVASW